jgi:hypothetical protein
MDSDYRALDLIERALDQAPRCSCGQPVIPVSREDGIWLECSAAQAAPRSRIGRLVALWTSPSHVREQLVDWILPAA